MPAHPLTFGGVAGASQSWSRLFWVQIVVATIGAAAVAWFFLLAWVPVVHDAIGRLPSEGSIQNGTLFWAGAAVTNLAGGKFLSIGVNLDGSGQAGSEADLQWEFGRHELRVRSILGYVALPYPRGWTMALNRVELEPWWGAWKPALITSCGAGVMIALFVCWSGLAVVYCLPVWVIGYFADRAITLGRAWRISAASLLPGALLLSCALIAYSFQQVSLIHLIVSWVLHLAVGWIYLIGAPFCIPAIQTRAKSKNPFVPAK